MRKFCRRLRERAQPAQVAAAMHCPAVTKSKSPGVRSDNSGGNLLTLLGAHAQREEKNVRALHSQVKRDYAPNGTAGTRRVVIKN